MTQEQLNAMKDAVRRTGKPVGSHPQLQSGTQLVRRRDNFRVTIESIQDGVATFITSKGDKFQSKVDSDLVAEFEVAR